MIENEIIFNWPEQDPPDANAIAYFVRAVASVDAIPRLRAEREQPFASKLRRHIEDWVPKRYLTPNWRAPQDSRQLYPVDMRFDVGDNVQLAFFIGNTNKASLTFGILKQLRDWDVSGQWLLAYSRLSNISRDALSRLIDASGDQASLVAIDPDDEARLKSMLTQRGVPVLSAS